MLKTVDVGLMANHLLAHKGIINRLEHYANSTNNQQLGHIIQQQIGTMKNHVQVMNQLLDPHHANPTSVPPIPQNTPNNEKQTVTGDIRLNDRDMALDAHFTANAMANDNFMSALNMKSQQVKNIHTEMALQQSQISNAYATLAEQLGWLSHPNATNAEQTGAINPLNNRLPHDAITHQPYVPQQPFHQ